MARFSRMLVNTDPCLGYAVASKPSNDATHNFVGYSLAFGVFQEYYGSHPHMLKGDSSNVAMIGTTMTVRSRHQRMSEHH